MLRGPGGGAQGGRMLATGSHPGASAHSSYFSVQRQLNEEKANFTTAHFTHNEYEWAPRSLSQGIICELTGPPTGWVIPASLSPGWGTDSLSPASH